MKLTKKVVALLLTAMLILTALPLSAFAAETATATLVYESDIYTDETLSGYQQYQGTWTDSTYVNGTVQYTVYYDTENATETRDVILYVINWNGERIGENSGEHSDVKIVYDNIMADPAVETGRRAMVIVVDFGGNTNAVAGKIEFSLAQFRTDLTGDTAPIGGASINKNYTFVLPAGYRVMRDVLYFQSDVHASLGTLNFVMSTWNTQVAFNPTNTTAAGRYANGKLPKTVNYYWHTGDDTCTCTANGATNECFAGSPQEKDGEIIACSGITITHTGDKTTCEYPHDALTTVKCTSGNTANVNWAPVVTRVEDCRKRDGSPMDYNCRLDIIYPSAGKDAGIETPVFTQAATQSPRMNNIGTIGWTDYDKDGVSSMKSRAAFVGFSFSGYTCAAYDYAYVPMARGDHYGYIDGYGFHGQNGAKTSRAAIRCIRYFAEELGYSSELIGAAGISKGTPTTAVLSTVDNKYVQETSTYTYTVNGESVETRGLYYEGDLNDDGSVTAGKTQQPYMYYEDGFNTTSESGTEISSEVSVVYCAAGDGINWVYGVGSNKSIQLGASYTYTDDEGVEQTRTTQHVPMILSCGFYDEYGCWNHFDDIQARFTEYAANPFLAIPMEDMGHDYPSGIDPIRSYDRYNAFTQFFHSILKPELYSADVAWTLPLDGETDIALDSTFQVQLLKPTENIDDVTVTDPYGNVLEGTWTTNGNNTSGLYTFIPSSGWLGGTEYTVTFPTTVVATETTRTFTTEAGGVLRPVADTFVSASYPDAVHGADTTLTINNQNFYVASFNTADFEDSNKATLNISLEGSATQDLSVYLINNLKIDEATYCYEDLPTLTEDMLIGTYSVAVGKNTLNLKDITARAKGENFTLVITGSANSLDLDYEYYSDGDKILSWNNYKTEGTFEGSPYRPLSDDDCFSTYYVAREGGSMPDMYATTDPEDTSNIAATFESTQTYNRYKFFNSFVRTKSYLTAEDLGKVFDISYRIRVNANGKTDPTLQVVHCIVEANKTNQKDTLTTPLTADTWTTVTDSIEITQEMVDLKAGLLGFQFNSTAGVRYYLDDIKVTERAPSTLVSRENTSAMTVYITTKTASEDQPLADAYTSALDPDTALGTNGKLMLSGGDDENVMFLTFPASILKGDYLDLRLPVKNDAGVTVEVYLLDGYYVDETTLTYNNMPDLSALTPIGTYKFTSGKNTVELALGEDDVTKTCFTLVFKSTDTSCHYYFEDFDAMEEGYKLPNTSECTTKTETVDGVETSVKYADGFSDTYFFRGGSNWGTGSLKVAADPHDDSNMALLGATSGGRARLMNALSHDALSTDDLDKTYRFSFKVKDADETAGTVQYGIMEANGYSKYYSKLYIYSSDANPVTNTAWRTVSVDYKLSETLGEAGVTIPNHPMVYIESTAYYYDDICVIELNDDGTEKRVLMSSGEGAETDADLISFRSRTVHDPIADTYVSAADMAINSGTQNILPGTMKDVNYGDGEELYISGANSYIGERVSLLTYTKDAIADGDVVILNLPAANDTSAKINIYLLDGYKINEATLNYTTYESEIKNNMTLVGTATLAKGNNKIELDTRGKVTSDYFTLILTAAETAEHIYLADFENWTAGTTGNGNATTTRNSYFQGYDSDGLKSLEGDFIGYSDKLFYTRGSNASYGYMTVVDDPDGSDNKVLEYMIGKYSGPRIKMSRTLSFDALTGDDIGDTYRFTFRIKAAYADGTVSTAASTMGAMRMYGSSYESNTAAANTSDSVSIQTNGEWYEFTYDYVIKEADLVADANTIAKHSTAVHSDPVFTIIFSNPDTSKVLYYYLDELQAVKLDDNGCEPVVTILSAENSDTEAVLPSVSAQNSLVPVADTYVSRVNPDTVYGNETTLKLGDANGDKKVMALSFMNKALDEGNYVQLSLPNGGNTRKDVSIYYVMDYCIDETSLTWNTMPDYEANLLDTYELVAGENKIDVSSLRDKLAGDYFTLIFRTDSHSFGLKFENYSSTQTFSDNKDNNETVDGITYYHGFYTDELLAKNGVMYSLGRRNGVLENRKIAVDPDDANNQVFTASTVLKNSYGGRTLFYNALSYKELTSADVGKTYRFSLKVRAAESNDEAIHDKLSANIDVTTSKGQLAVNTLKDANGNSTADSVKYIKKTASASELLAGWVTLSLEYTVHKAHVPYANDSATYSYPMFNIYFADTDASYAFTYLVDDVSVVEVVDGEPVGDATFASREEAEEVRFTSMLNGNVTVMETTVSSATTGDVFSIVDGNKTHTLLSVDNGNLVFGDKTLCDGKGVAYELGDEIKVTAIYDDTLGTVRFAIGNKLAFYEADKATYNHVMIEGGVGDDAVFGVSGITATKMNNTTSELIGYQKNLVDDTSVRFLSGVDTLYYSAIGFDVERDGVAIQKQSSSPYVFSAVTIGEETEEATEYGYNYMTALVIGDITTGGVIKVTPYVMIGENKISGASSYYKITANGGMTLEKTTEDEVEKAYSADLKSITVDGEPVVGFDADVLAYSVPASDPTAMTVVAVAAEEGATAVLAQNGNVATVTVTSFNGKVQKVYTLTAYEKLASAVVNKNGANAIVTYVFDDGDKTTATIVTEELSTKYESLAGSFALITKNLGTLSTIEGEEGDGLEEYEFDENGDYVYTKNETNWEYWETLLGTYGASGFEAVSHTHTHAYIGEDDNGGSFTYKNTNGDVFTSSVFPKGNVHKEYYASNQILRDLGQRAYALVSAGLTAGGYMIDYTDNYKALPQTSGAFIGKRTTYTNPTNPSSMVNAFDSFDNEDNRFNVLSYMVQHYNTSSTAPKSTSADTYSKEACLAAGVDYWTGYVDTAVEEGGWAAFCFHNIRPDTHTGTTGHFVYQSQADALFAHTQTLSEENKVWVANLTDAMLYVFERSTSEVGAYIDGNGNVVVSLDDHEDDTIFNMALTVKVALPEGKTSAALDGNALTSFVEDNVTYVYVDIVPGNSVTLTVQ